MTINSSIARVELCYKAPLKKKCAENHRTKIKRWRAKWWKKTPNRWLILIASIISNLRIGSVYSWSVFQKPLIDLFKWTPSETLLTFTLIVAMMPISMTIAGMIMQQKRLKIAMAVGAVLYGTGIFLAGFSSSLNFLYLTHGVVAGLGVGTVCGCAMSNTVKWFPDKKGLASGLIAGGLGFGTVIFSPIRQLPDR